MKQVFSAKSPIIKLNSGVSQSEQDEQLGYMEIYSGCMTASEIQVSHEHEWEDSETKGPYNCLELQTIWLKSATSIA